jgi:Tfp pilus assembly protein PilX
MKLTLTLKRQRGIALPVMLLMMLTMLATSIFLIKSINSTTLTSSNLAYESAQARQADQGLATAFQWLSSTAYSSKSTLNSNNAAAGYVANWDTSKKVSDPAFWVGKQTIVDATTNTSVEYVIHRMCKFTGSYDPPANQCVLTVDAASTASSVTPGQSLGLGNTTFDSAPQVHYVVTSRIFGARGGNVVNQLVVLIGA